MIYAFNTCGEAEAIANSIKTESLSRFGWSYIDSADLTVIKDLVWSEMSEEQVSIWKKTHFLLSIKPGDWVVHINTPSYGRCIAAKVVEPYHFDITGIEGDYRHCLTVDTDTVIEFDRNDILVHPVISRRLKLQGHKWRIYYEKEFAESIDALNNKKDIQPIENKELYHLKNELDAIFTNITGKIHSTHPEKKLEYLMCSIFKNIPNVTEAYVNGSGWGTDHGADIIVKYNSGIDILNLQKQETLVVQVKSFEGEHYDLNCVKQIETAIKKFDANCAMLITTAKSTIELENAINELGERLSNLPIAIMSGGDVAKFILKYENNSLIEM